MIFEPLRGNYGLTVLGPEALSKANICNALLPIQK